MRRNTLSYWTRHTFPIVRHVHLQDVMIPSGNLLFKATKTKSRELTDRGSQLLTNALHDYHAERIMENLHWPLLVVVVEEECKKVIKTRFYVYRSLLEDFCTENVITSAKIKWECWEKILEVTFCKSNNSTCFVGEKTPWYGRYIRFGGFAFTLSHK